jgi:hypothetical protein
VRQIRKKFSEAGSNLMGMIYDLQNAQNEAESGDQWKISWLDLGFVSQDRYQESEYGQELISRFTSLSILIIKGNGRSDKI